jgi:hypothetical protein
VQGAQATAYANGSQTGSAVTDTSGNYTLTVATVSNSITFTAGSYFAQTVTGIKAEHRQTTTVNALLTQFGTLRGIVTRSDSGAGAAGTCARVLQNGTTVQEMAVDISGNYWFILATGAYTVSLSSPGFFPLEFPAQAVFFQSTTTVSTPLMPVCGLRGKIGDPAGAGLTGALITASGTTPAVAAADASGNYYFSVGPGAYTLSVASAGHFSTSQQALCSAFSTTTVDFSMVPAGTFSGKVAGDSGPVAGALVSVVLNGSAVLSAATDGAGNYLLTVPTGTYTLEVTLDDYYKKTLSGRSVGTGETVSTDVYLARRVTLGGRITRMDGRTPVPGALVSVLLDGATVQAVAAGVYGDYLITAATGVYSVSVTSGGYLSVFAKEVNVRLGQNTASFCLTHVPSVASAVDNNAHTNIALLYNNTTLTVVLEPRTFDTAVLMTISSCAAAPSSLDPSIKITPVAFDIDSGNRQPLQAITLTFAYDPLELPGCDESKLAVARWDPDKGKWVLLASSVNRQGKTITAFTNHLCLFSIVELCAQKDLSGVRVYPNPFEPRRDTSGLTFDKLSSGTTIKIYTVAGELVRELEDASGTGLIRWDGRNTSGQQTASGVYIAVLNSGGAGARNIKFAVIK